MTTSKKNKFISCKRKVNSIARPSRKSIGGIDFRTKELKNKMEDDCDSKGFAIAIVLRTKTER